MLAKRPTGQGAASIKYDVLTALGVHACAQPKARQKLVLRFMTAITARYNWHRNDLSMGRAEFARLWHVDERTVRRELSKLKALGWIAVKRAPGRGRVAVYGVDWDAVLNATRLEWKGVGPDFESRMDGSTDHAQDNSRIVAFPVPPAPEGADEWRRALALLHQADPALHANWLAQLRRAGLTDGVLELEAPGAFQAEYVNTHAGARITRAVQQVAPHVRRVVVRPA